MKHFRAKLSFIIVLFAIFLFMLFRLLILRSYPQVFEALTFGEICMAFVQGFRFDFAMCATFVLPFILLLNLPINNKVYAKTVLYMLLFVLVVMAGTLVGDYVYFDYVSKHMAEELLALKNDLGFIVSYTFSELWYVLILVGGAFAGLVWGGNRLINKYFTAEKGSVLRITIILFLILFGIRGQIFSLHKPIGIADAYNYASTPAAANLTLNGVFTSFHTLRKGTTDMHNPMPEGLAISAARDFLAEDGVEFISEEYPLMRRIVNDKPMNKYNVFVVLLEGWSPFYVDGLNQGAKRTFGATPFFDSILKDSIVFENAYSSSLRSIFGFGSSFTGVPLVPGLPVFGYGLEMSSLSSIGADVGAEGYYTIFTQASKRDSYRMCALASGALGMQDSYGREDLKELLPYEERAAFGYDYDALMFTAAKVKDKQNFLALTFTAITHAPFTITTQQFEKYPRDTEENMFLNSLYYADYSLQSLVQQAKAEGWFDNTIFIFLSDHSSNSYKRTDLKSTFKIPFVIYAPGIVAPKRIKYTVSQSDLLPTIYALLNLKKPYTALGKNALSGGQNRAAFFSSGATVGIINGHGALVHNGMRAVEVQPADASFNQIEAADLVLSLDKAAGELISKNKWFSSK